MILQTPGQTVECRGCDAQVSCYSLRRGFPYCLRCADEIDALRDQEWRRRHRRENEHRSARVLFGMAVVWVLLLVVASLARAQVPPHLYVERATFEIGSNTASGFAEVLIGNPQAGPALVTVSVHRDARDEAGNVVPGDSVSSLISPKSFTLDPGATQIVRVVIVDSIAPGEMLRLVTVLDPQTNAGAIDLETPSAATTARLRLRLRYVTKLEVR